MAAYTYFGAAAIALLSVLPQSVAVKNCEKDSSLDPDNMYWPVGRDRNLKNGSIQTEMLPKPFAACERDEPWSSDECVEERTRAAKEAHYLGDHVELGYSTGCLGAWVAGAGAQKGNIRYLKARDAHQVSEAIVEFRARATNNPQIIVKNTGHDYLGRSQVRNEDLNNDILVIWTHHMQSIEYHGDNFPWRDPAHKPATSAPLELCGKTHPHAITIGSGLQMMYLFTETPSADVYRPSQTVGIAGHSMDGGYGMWPKLHGSTADIIAQLEVVTTDGTIKILNECSNGDDLDLFKAFKGGGGSYGVVTKFTYSLKGVLTKFGRLQCESSVIPDRNKMLEILRDMLQVEDLYDAKWGGVIRISLRRLQMWLFYGEMTQEEAEAKWHLFITKYTDAGSLQCKWTPMDPHKLGFIQDQDVMVSKSGKRWWEYQSFEDYIVGFENAYLPFSETRNPSRLAEKFLEILEAGLDANTLDKGNFIQYEVSKGLYGATDQTRADQRLSSINPKAYDGVALLYVRSYLFHYWEQVKDDFRGFVGASQGASGVGIGMAFDDAGYIYSDKERALAECSKKPDPYEAGSCIREYIVQGAIRSKARVQRSGARMRELLPGAGTFINHGNYDQADWAETGYGSTLFSFLESVKKKFDPQNLIRYHHAPLAPE